MSNYGVDEIIAMKKAGIPLPISDSSLSFLADKPLQWWIDLRGTGVADSSIERVGGVIQIGPSEPVYTPTVPNYTDLNKQPLQSTVITNANQQPINVGAGVKQVMPGYNDNHTVENTTTNTPQASQFITGVSGDTATLDSTGLTSMKKYGSYLAIFIGVVMVLNMFTRRG